MGTGTDAETIRYYQRPLMKAVEWHIEKIRRERPESAAANSEYENLTALKIALRNPREGLFGEPFRLLYAIVVKHRDYLKKERESPEVDKKKIQEDIDLLDKFLHQMND